LTLKNGGKKKNMDPKTGRYIQVDIGKK